MSNLLAMPLVDLQVETSNNEDWIDSIVYYVNTGATSPPELDLRGITFDMEIRRTVGAHEVVLSASTDFGTLKIGIPPAFGHFLFNIPIEQMSKLNPNVYVGDIVGRDLFYTRQVATIQLTINAGITVEPIVNVNLSAA